MALPALVTTPLVGRLAGAQFRRSPRRTVWLSAALLLGFNLAIVGWWTHTVATTIVLGAAGFACVAAAIAAVLPVAQAVIPPQTRAQGFGAFINTLFIGAFVAGAPLVDFWPELERQHTTLSFVVTVLTVVGAGLMPTGPASSSATCAGWSRSWRRSGLGQTPRARAPRHPLLQVRNLDFSYGLGPGPLRHQPRGTAAARRSRCSAPTARGSPRCCA